MQIKEPGSKMENYRPPQSCLNLFWTLTEGNDDKRVGAAIELVKMIQAVEKKAEREQITTYCVNRLVRGLGSGRKFARVGFSTALTLLLRLQSELKTNQVLSCFNDKLKAERNAFSKSEKAALYLGRAFALSAIIQSGRISKVDGDMLGSIVEELLTLSGKRSFLKPVCCHAIENLITEVSGKSFAEYVWPKLRDKLVLGWEGCTLDRISLLLACKEKFPDIVNKKFIKKHWGPSIFCEDNDDKLLQAVKNSSEKSTTLREKILPFIVTSGRSALSIWKGIGEKMFSSGKDVLSQQQLLSLETLSNLITLSSDPQEILSLILDPSVTKAVFLENYTDNETLSKTLNVLVSNVCEKLKTVGGDILTFVKKILELEGETEEGAHDGRLSYIHSHNFTKIVSLMDKTEMEQYVGILINYVKGNDDNRFFSESGKKREKQLDWCFRQLQHVSCSQSHTTPDMQRTVLALFLRNGYFKADKKNNTVLHCDFLDRFVETSNVKKLCESFLFKSLDQLSTMKTDQDSKSKRFSYYLDLLSYLVHYFQSLLSCKDVQLVSLWSDETHEVWKQLMKKIKSVEKTKSPSSPDADSAFKLLFYYMAFYMLTDAKAAADLLKDIFVCYDNSTVKEKTKKKESENEDPFWVEVLTEILLQLLSFQSHLARVISSMVFKLIVPHINAESVALITQVLIPNKTQQNMFEENKEDEGDDEEDENGGLLDDDVPSEESEDDDEEEEEEANDNHDEEGEEVEEDEDGEDKMDIDEMFRQSIKGALGNAAVNDDEDDDDLPDLSDSEMMKFDEALAEVFRQRKRKTGLKKAKVEKRKELGNFRLRVLDLLDVLIKSDRCGDFLLDMMKPLVVLMFSSTQVEEQAACNRAKSSFQLLKTRCKGITDSVHTEEEQLNMFQELMDLAHRVNESSQLQQIAQACFLVIKVSSANCLQILQDILNNIINKKQSKPLPSFFISLLDTDPVVFQPLCTILIDCVDNESAKQQCRSMACSLLTSLAKKRGSASSESGNSWMMHAAQVVCKHIQALDKDSTRGLFVRELLTLTLALLGRTDILSAKHFEIEMKQTLLEVKSKMGTDARRLTNKIIAGLDRLAKENEVSGKKRKAKDTETNDTESPRPRKKKRKTDVTIE